MSPASMRAHLRPAPGWISTHTGTISTPRGGRRVRCFHQEERGDGSGRFDLSRRTSFEFPGARRRPADRTVISPAGLLRCAMTFGASRITGQHLRRSSHSVVWRTRVEIVAVHYSLQPVGKWDAHFQDVSFVPFRQSSLAARVIVFDTPTFDSRVMSMRRTWPGSCQTPALYGKDSGGYFSGPF